LATTFIKTSLRQQKQIQAKNINPKMRKEKRREEKRREMLSEKTRLNQSIANPTWNRCKIFTSTRCLSLQSNTNPNLDDGLWYNRMG